MEQSAEFRAEISAAVANRREQLDRKSLPRLKERLRTYQALFENIYNVLRQKGQIDEDPYKGVEQISEVTVPSSDPFTEAERRVQMSSRLSALHTQLEYINSYYSFTTEFLSLERIRTLGQIVRYINWSNLSGGSGDYISDALAHSLARIRGGSDQMAVSIVNDAARQLAQQSSATVAELKELAAFHRQSYKLAVRNTVLDAALAELPERDGAADPARAQQLVKKHFTKAFAAEPFYPELVDELLAEELGADAQAAREQALGALATKTERKQRADPRAERMQLLNDALRTLATAAPQMQSALVKLEHNAAVVESRRRSLAERLRNWFAKAVRKRPQAVVYTVDYRDPQTRAVRQEHVEFAAFTSELRQKARLLRAIADRSSSTHKKLQSASEDQVFELLERNITEVQLLYRRALGLGLHFAAAAAPAQRAHLKGIKIEMSGVKNNLVKTSQRRHEYAAKREEDRQMERLGIADQGAAQPVAPRDEG